MKKAALCLTMVLLVTMVLSTMVSCSTQEQEYHEKNPTPTVDATTQQPVYTYDTEWTPMPQHTNSKGEVLEGNPYDYINPERLFNIGETFELQGFRYCVNSVEIQKDKKGIDTSRLFEPDLAWVNDNCSFLIINIEIENDLKEEIELCVGGIKPWMQQKDNGYNVADTRYIEPEMYHDNHAWFYLFQPGEKVNFKIVSVIEDKFLTEEPLYIFVEADGMLVDLNESLYDYNSYVVINKDKSEVDVYA